ncbi:MAG: hypothetical protein KGY38_06950 [Desulfobacterales bacterium]|nr:hypothetical protein [Desulfobacterales bacterium]
MSTKFIAAVFGVGAEHFDFGGLILGVLFWGSDLHNKLKYFQIHPTKACFNPLKHHFCPQNQPDKQQPAHVAYMERHFPYSEFVDAWPFSQAWL